jgi:predicted nucleic acid-binding Zn ribbon protein
VAQWGPGLQLRPAMAAARAANTASSNNFVVSCIEDVWGRKEKEVSNWAKELGCTRDQAGPVMKEADGLSGKKIKWVDLIFLNYVSIIY